MKYEANGQGGDHIIVLDGVEVQLFYSFCLLYTSPSPRD